MKTILKIPWSKQVKLLTTGFILTIFLAEAFLLMNLFSIWEILAAIVLPLVTVYYGLSAPLSFTLDDTQMTLNKVWGTKKFEYNFIEEGNLYEEDGSDIRLMGSGGLFGYIGKFTNKKLGRYQSYVMDYKQTFWIKLKNGKTYMFSCEDRNKIISILKMKTNGLSGE